MFTPLLAPARMHKSLPLASGYKGIFVPSSKFNLGSLSFPDAAIQREITWRGQAYSSSNHQYDSLFFSDPLLSLPLSPSLKPTHPENYTESLLADLMG